MLISIVIPTCHRNALLAKCLDCLALGRQTGAEVLPAGGGEEQRRDAASTVCYEVIVSDDGSRSDSREMIAKDYPWVNWMAGPKRGPAANRNFGAGQGRGEWIAFVDDDCLPSPGWVRALCEAARLEPIEVVEGKTVCPGKRDNPFEEHVENLTGGVYWSCNLAVRREAFEALGGFDEAFLEAGGEDMEFAWRIKKQGLRCRFAPGLLVLHPPRHMTWRMLWRRVFMIRWVLLYRLRTEGAPPLDASAFIVLWSVVADRMMELLRTTSHLVTRFEAGTWRRRLFFQALKWVTFPAVLPYLMLWEFRFRRQLGGPQTP